MAIKPTRFGLSCAITTPMSPDGEIDLVRFAKHARFVLAEGCDSITLFGTTGEGAQIGLEDRARILGAMAGAGVAPRERLYAGVAAASPQEAHEQARMALDAGVKGLLVAPPFYFKGVSDEGLFRWFARFIEALRGDARGLVLYHIPSVTAVDISVELVSRLKAAFPGVVIGVKDSSCVWATTEAFLRAHGDLAILVGDERLLARAVREGGEGSICGLANFVPGWLRPVVYQGQDDARIAPLVEAISAGSVLPSVKALVGHLHRDPGFGGMRPPLLPLGDAERARLFAAYDSITRAEAA